MEQISNQSEVEQPVEEPPQPERDRPSFFKRLLLGKPKNLHDPKVFHHISLIAFLAWVGLGADGLSSSAYGPDEAFRELGEHTYLALGLAAAIALTVFIISYAYSRIIEHFPSGGGGYVVASKLLGPKFGVVSGSALLVDYVLTISVSIAASVDALFSLAPQSWHQYKLITVIVLIVFLTFLNLRGIKESVTILMPIFLIFVVSHVILIFGGIITHLLEVKPVIEHVSSGFNKGLSTLGWMGMFLVFARAYSRGAGTYTGIEAVSNGLAIMREPRIKTAKRTMLYMSVSLAITASGIMICYLLFHAHPTPGKTMNAVLLENFAGGAQLWGIPIGDIFVWIALVSSGALLFVAAQAGFIDGPRIMANMAADSYFPHRFTSLSDRLTMQNGVMLMSVAALAVMIYTGGDTSTLILMYSINVFLTFSLSQTGMIRFWIGARKKYKDWKTKIIIHCIGWVLCVGILILNIAEKFTDGGWVTVVVTTLLIIFCIRVKQHYNEAKSHIRKIDEALEDLPLPETANEKPLERNASTAVLVVGGYGGIGLHTLFGIQRLFPNIFKNVIFVSIGVLDSVTMKEEEYYRIKAETDATLKRYVELTRKVGIAADYRLAVGIDVVDEAEKVCLGIAKEYPRSVFFASKLIFQREKWYHRFLHNQTATLIQQRLQFAGLNMMVMPVRIYDVVKKIAVSNKQ